uniref:Movement protein n=1 Tax=Ascaris lumbricoides TaxID=6252 RepID=A0A0M3IEB2_ASCLU
MDSYPKVRRRSPYRLYRPYQLEIPESTFATNPTLLYRNPSFDILSEVNKRARRLERTVSYQKVLSIIQILLSLLLLVLETTKILLIWEYTFYWDQKFQLMSFPAAVQLGRVMDRSLSNDMTSAMVDIEPSSRTLRILQGHAILSFNNGYTTKQVSKMRIKDQT